jgi:hypothetical protein
MKVRVESVLPCPPDEVWAEVQRPALLVEVVRPLILLKPADAPQFPDRWQQGTTVRFRSYLFSLIPVDLRTVLFERVDDAARQIQTREHDLLVRHWDHLISVQPVANGQTLYSDEIIFSGGPFSPLVWLFALWFYRHRHRRWQRVARRISA